MLAFAHRTATRVLDAVTQAQLNQLKRRIRRGRTATYRIGPHLHLEITPRGVRLVEISRTLITDEAVQNLIYNGVHNDAFPERGLRFSTAGPHNRRGPSHGLHITDDILADVAELLAAHQLNR